MSERDDAGQASDLRSGIQTAYRELRRDGYYCRSNFWCCMACGLAAIPDDRSDKYVFYHRQDDQDIDREGYCYLAWAGDGRQVSQAMEGARLAVEWDGSRHTRICVRNR